MRFFVELSFKGTNYHGWQIQKNALAVQDILDETLSTILREPIETLGCGRTDTGVHARQFYAHFDTNVRFDLTKAVFSMNSMLPYDIAVKRFFPVDPKMHARFDAVSRTYRYHLCFEKNPFYKNLVTYLPYTPDIAAMNEACGILKEFTDFASFSKTHTQVKTTLCRIDHAEWYWEDDQMIFQITADRFLRNMVRAIVGTMLNVGKKEIGMEEFRKIIETGNRSDAGMSVAAEGLYLCSIEYNW